MKTTIDLADSLVDDARRVAVRDGTTLRALMEQGLRYVIAQRDRETGFVLRDESFGGDGLQPEAADLGWDRLREIAYESRGGSER
jgi:hypothetical protein